MSEGHPQEDIPDALTELWPREVWELFISEGPLLWQEAQKRAAALCRRLKKSYGRESVARHAAFREFMKKIFGDTWQEVATAGSRAEAMQALDHPPASP